MLSGGGVRQDDRNGSAVHLPGGPWFLIRLARDGWAEISLYAIRPPTRVERLLGTFWRRMAVAAGLLGAAVAVALLATKTGPRWLIWVALILMALGLVVSYLYPAFKDIVFNLRRGFRAIGAVRGRRPVSVDKLRRHAGAMRVSRFSSVAHVGLTVQPHDQYVAVVTFRDGLQLPYVSADDTVYRLLSSAVLTAQGGRIE